MSQARELNKIVRDYQRRGWTVDRTRGGHWRFFPPGVRDRFVITSGTPDNERIIRNIKSDLRRCEKGGRA